MNTSKVVAALALAFGASFGAHAAPFDPDGAGGAPAIDVGAFGWSTTSAVAQGGNTAIRNFVAGTGSTTFNVLTHARLVDTTNSAGTPNTPSGLNTACEITMVVRFQEQVSAVTANSATFTTTGPGLLQIFASPIVNSNSLTGFGFNDGRLILQGTLVQSGRTGAFIVTDPTATQMDCFGGSGPACPANADSYGGQQSVTGFGSQLNTAFDTLVTDPTYFLSALQTFGISFANISQQIPFTSVDPSDCFSPLAAPSVVGTTAALGTCANVHVNAPYSGQGADGQGGYVPVTGAVDGLLTQGADFVFQTRFNSPVAAVVPEPDSVALIAIGLLGLGALKRRRAKK